jgi:hypothetical protein
MPAPNMTEDEARDLLQRWPGGGGLEDWIAERRWQATPDGWNVTDELQGRRFKIEVIIEGPRVSAYAAGGTPDVWTITI